MDEAGSPKAIKAVEIKTTSQENSATVRHMAIRI
jgi:hypothetical protein